MSPQVPRATATPSISDFIGVFENEEPLINDVCDRFFQNHPDYSDAYRRYCREDMLQNLRCLACAVACGEFDLFRNYLLWLREILEKRGIPATHLTEAFALLGEELERNLDTAILPAYRDFLERGMVLLETPRAELPETGSPAKPEPAAVRYLELILAGDRQAAEAQVTDLLRRNLRYVDIVTDVVQPAMIEVGRAWQENRISVAQEHLATAITHGILARCLMQIEPRPPVGATAVFACVAGNQHGLGLLTVSDAFELEGWHSHYLGANTPTAHLVNFIKSEQPRLLGLSLSLPQHVLEVKRIIDEIRDSGVTVPTILAGGVLAGQLRPLLFAYGVHAVIGDARGSLQYAVP